MMRNKLLILSVLVAAGLVGCNSENNEAAATPPANVEQQASTAMPTGDSNIPSEQNIKMEEKLPSVAAPQQPVVQSSQVQPMLEVTPATTTAAASDSITPQNVVQDDNAMSSTQQPSSGIGYSVSR